VLVHGDFNPANFLYDNGRVTALIDWENAHWATRARTWAGCR
jgi:aminoglycoside phosphotransferase (APT) family kinase protein